MKIASTAEISIETLNDIIAEYYDEQITIQSDTHYKRGKTYDVFEMLTIKRAIEEFLKGCPNKTRYNNVTDKDIFTYIYVKLALSVEYDDLAKDVNHANPTFKKLYAGDYLDTASGLDGALISKVALCSVFAETLRNLLAEKGIEAKYMSGMARPTPGVADTPSHAWNQVKLDGVWYNCDVTHDRSFIKEGLVAPNFLRSNAHFKNYTQYPILTGASIEPATHNVSTTEQESLMRYYRPQIRSELAPKTETKKTTQPGFFKSILTKLHIIKSSQPGDK